MSETHIDYMRSFVPFKANFKDIVTELQDDPGLAIETKALETVKSLCSSGKGLIILTGNAGHGKTFICREILFDFLKKDRKTKSDVSDVIAKLRDDAIGKEGITAEGKTLIIHKDLSDMGIKTAAGLLETALDRADERATLVCVNEGRLREVIQQIKDASAKKEIQSGLKGCIEEGVASRDKRLVFINMNFQSVTAKRNGGTSIFEDAMTEWLDVDARWESCEACVEKARCPIYGNRQLLRKSSDVETENRRRSGVVFLFRLAELYGHPTTIREMLMLLGYVITGGLSCNEIRIRDRKRPEGGWQSEFAFHQLIFGDGKSTYDLNQLPLLKQLRFFDPAKGAWRASDDRYVLGMDESEEENDLKFLLERDSKPRCAHKTMQGTVVVGTGSESGAEEEEGLKKAASLLRRRDFFDLWQVDGSQHEWNLERANRLGLEGYQIFTLLLEKRASEEEENEAKKKLVAGLHAVQGISPWYKYSMNRLMLIHSAFIRLENDNSPLNAKERLTKIKLLTKPAAWNVHGDGARKVSETTDSSPQVIILSIKGEELILNLERYGYLTKAANGYFAKIFYSSDIRQIQNYLASISAKSESDDPSVLQIVTEDGGLVEYDLANLRIDSD